MKEQEKRTRSAVKSIVWRIMGFIILAIVTYCFTGSYIQTGMITIIDQLTSLVVFYLHERIWLKMKKPEGELARSLCKMFTYETVFGNIILGIVSYLVTRNWKTMTAITLTYVSIKHVMYICNEFVWKRFSWGKN